jgi:hypothetical protein
VSEVALLFVCFCRLVGFVNRVCPNDIKPCIHQFHLTPGETEELMRDESEGRFENQSFALFQKSCQKRRKITSSDCEAFQQESIFKSPLSLTFDLDDHLGI